MMYGGWYGVASRYDRVVSLIVGPYAGKVMVPSPERLESMWRQNWGDTHECPPGITWGPAFVGYPKLLLGSCNAMLWATVQTEPITLWGE